MIVSELSACVCVCVCVCVGGVELPYHREHSILLLASRGSHSWSGSIDTFLHSAPSDKVAPGESPPPGHMHQDSPHGHLTGFLTHKYCRMSHHLYHTPVKGILSFLSAVKYNSLHNRCLLHGSFPGTLDFTSSFLKPQFSCMVMLALLY